MSEPIIGRLNYEGLMSYIKQTLGAGIFSVELTTDQINNAIVDALTLYSSRKPIIRFRSVQINPQIKVYPLDHDIGFGIFDVQWGSPDPEPSALFYSNLLGATPV